MQKGFRILVLFLSCLFLLLRFFLYWISDTAHSCLDITVSVTHYTSSYYCIDEESINQYLAHSTLDSLLLFVGLVRVSCGVVEPGLNSGLTRLAFAIDGDIWHNDLFIILRHANVYDQIRFIPRSNFLNFRFFVWFLLSTKAFTDQRCIIIGHIIVRITTTRR